MKSGADVIIGHNSVVQKVEKYKNATIFYSLGNLTSDSFLSKTKRYGSSKTIGMGRIINLALHLYVVQMAK